MITLLFKDEVVSSADVEDIVDLKKRTPNDFHYYRNETPIVLKDDSGSGSDSGSSSGNDNPIKEIIDDIFKEIEDIVNGSGDGGSGSDIPSGGKMNATGSTTNSSSDVGKYQDVTQEQSTDVSSESTPASSKDATSQEPSNGAAYDLSEKNYGLSNNSINQFTVLIVIFVILLIYGFYRGRKDS